MPIALMEALVSPDKLGLREQTVVYGMTETSPVSFGCGESQAFPDPRLSHLG